MAVAKWKARQLARARVSARFKRSQQPRKAPHAQYKKKDFVEAMKGTGGIRSEIARNLGCSYGTVANLLAREDWADVLELYNDEVDAGTDDAERCIRDAINQRLDIATASRSAQWLLSHRRRKQYGDDVKTTVVEGGDNPIKILQANIPVETLALPVEVRRQILEALDRREQQQLNQQRQHLLEQKP